MTGPSHTPSGPTGEPQTEPGDLQAESEPTSLRDLDVEEALRLAFITGHYLGAQYDGPMPLEVRELDYQAWREEMADD